MIIAGCDYTLHAYAYDIPHIKDVLHGNGNTTLVHVLRKQNMCANFMAKEGSHARCSTYWNSPPSGMESLILQFILEFPYIMENYEILLSWWTILPSSFFFPPCFFSRHLHIPSPSFFLSSFLIHNTFID